jgi:hypothetical protein
MIDIFENQLLKKNKLVSVALLNFKYSTLILLCLWGNAFQFYYYYYFKGRWTLPY